MADENPFRVPPDDQIFVIREQERQRRAEEREARKAQHVWEKTTACSRVARNFRVDPGPDDVPELSISKGRGGSRMEVSVGRDSRREKENVQEFVAKKREMFLVQMSLDVKKAEIVKLDERAKAKEEALKRSQQMLEEDMTRFDSFLSTNDSKAHKAMKKAEDMTKQKQEKMQKIKQLKSQLSAIQSEIAKHQEQKNECHKFKGFLDKLTPQEWKDQKDQEKKDRKKMRRQRAVERRMADVQSKMQAELEAEERAAEEKERETARSGNRRRQQRKDVEEEAKEKEKEAESRRRRIRKKYPTQEQIEAEYEDISSGEETPLYFEEPKQLLDVFTTLEEQNLFLIQNLQDKEEMEEYWKEKNKDLTRTATEKIGKLKQRMEKLERDLAEEHQKCEELRLQLSQGRGDSLQREMLNELEKRVQEVNAAIGSEVDTESKALDKLTNIEARLEVFLKVLHEAEASGDKETVDLLRELERNKEKDRRELVKKQKKEQAEKKNADRLEASLQRSEAPVHKKVGKQLMFRSRPLIQTKRVEQEDDGYEEAVKDYALFGIWMNRNKDDIPEASTPKREG
ncbi:unnamed protein product [Prorocentrum cordatum]|uniref:DUF4200 domain-containing protein n=1 Tax=Prorocentrum cordatum TaxID=2364126 RepID=A0ABN9SDG7_9DINO|nr:unnamed protein product [Polarella glacialis]